METYRDLLSQIHTNCKNIPFHKKLSAYNIFDVLEIQSREVIMCRFLTNLLNPEGYIAIAYGGSQRVPDR